MNKRRKISLLGKQSIQISTFQQLVKCTEKKGLKNMFISFQSKSLFKSSFKYEIKLLLANKPSIFIFLQL